MTGVQTCALPISSSIDTLQLWHGYVHVSYKPLTGYVFKTYFLGKITKQVETPLKEEQVIALLKKKRGKG